MPQHSKKPRTLNNEEKVLIQYLVKALPAGRALMASLDSLLVHDMADGDMGSVQLIDSLGQLRKSAVPLVRATYRDADGVLVSIQINVDQRGGFYELDIWKSDFSQLVQYPTPSTTTIEQSHG